MFHDVRSFVSTLKRLKSYGLLPQTVKKVLMDILVIIFALEIALICTKLVETVARATRTVSTVVVSVLTNVIYVILMSKP